MFDPAPQALLAPAPAPAAVAWLETKDPTETYDYAEPKTCLLTQYFQYIGLGHFSVGGWGQVRNERYELVMTLPREFEYVAQYRQNTDSRFIRGPRTFGEALAVALAL